jgi:hypothetical protein
LTESAFTANGRRVSFQRAGNADAPERLMMT